MGIQFTFEKEGYVIQVTRALVRMEHVTGCFLLKTIGFIACRELSEEKYVFKRGMLAKP